MLKMFFQHCIALSVCITSLQVQAEIDLKNVTVVDVTPTEFSVIWQSDEVSDPQIAIYESANREKEITSDFEVATYPMQGAGEELANFEQRNYLSALKEVTRSKGLSKIRVGGLTPDSQYFFRVFSNSNSNSNSGHWPLVDTYSVKTEQENSFSQDAVQLIVDINEEGSNGWLVYALIEGAKYPVSAVVEAGIGNGRAVINLSNLFTDDGQNWDSSDVSLVSPRISVMKGEGGFESELFDGIELSSEFNVATNITITLNDKSLPLPPIIEPLGNIVTHEGGQVEFLIIASDPNMTIPSLTIEAAPLGAEFEYDASGELEGQGIFRWSPVIGQAGSYTITFIASDGVLEVRETTVVKVNSAADKDGDDLQDSWEIEYFGNLDQESGDDFDQDGYSNLEELEKGWDPTLTTLIPSVPTIKSPIFNDEVRTLSPTLEIINSLHSADIEVQYMFELYFDSSMKDLGYSALVDEGVDSTSVTIDETSQGGVLTDNHMYYWRARGTSPAGGREWVIGQFFVNTENDLPSQPAIRSPTTNSLVSVSEPTLSVTNSYDLDGDSLKYHFKIYQSGADLESTPLYQISDLVPGPNGFTEWQVPAALIEDAQYSWYVDVSDEHGASQRSEVANFIMSTQNDSPGAPIINLPSDNEEVVSISPIFGWSNAFDPEGAVVQYELQLNLSETFDEATNQVFTISQNNDGFTQWQLTELLNDNSRYYWRIRSFDGELYGSWSQSQFFVNTVNDAPSSPTVANPADEAIIEVVQPLLVVNPSQDLDGDNLSYRYEVYGDEGLDKLISEHLATSAEWQVSQALTDNSYVYWRVRAEDEHGAISDWTPAHKFFVNNLGVNDPAEFNFVLPSADIELIDGDVLIQWTDSDPDSNAVISLWYERADDGIGVIAENITEDADGEADQFIWHISELAVGSYNIKATVLDGDNRLDLTAPFVVNVLPAQGHVETTLITKNELDEFGQNIVQVNVVLDRAPVLGASVTINLRLSDIEEASIYKVEQEGVSKPKNYLYFTTDNWDKPASIYVRGEDDCIVDGTSIVDLIFESVSSSDLGFDGVDPADVVLKNHDNEESGQTLFVCSYVKISQVLGGGGLVDVTYRAQLNNTGEPRLNPVAELAVLAEGVSIVGGDTVTFPNIESGVTVESLETFTLRYDPNNELDQAKLKWTISSEPPQADLSVELEGRDGEWDNGAISFATIVTNEGPSTSQSTVLAVVIPEELSIDDVSGAECNIDSGKVDCLLGSIEVGVEHEVLFKVGTTDKKTKFKISASVSSSIEDADQENNTSSDKYGGAFHFWALIGFLLLISYRKRSVRINTHNKND